MILLYGEPLCENFWESTLSFTYNRGPYPLVPSSYINPLLLSPSVPLVVHLVLSPPQSTGYWPSPSTHQHLSIFTLSILFPSPSIILHQSNTRVYIYTHMSSAFTPAFVYIPTLTWLLPYTSLPSSTTPPTPPTPTHYPPSTSTAST